MTNNCSKCSLDTLLSASPYRRNPKYLSSAHLTKQKATKINFTSDQKSLSSARRKAFWRGWMDWRFVWRLIGKKPRTLAKLLACFVLSYFLVLTTKFYWRSFEFIAAFVWLRFFSAILASLLAKGSASIQLICQSAWLGLLLLLLLAVARVICKIHCSTISVVCCVVFRLAVFLFTSSWREDSANQVTDKLNWLSLLLLFDVIFFAAV